jgi:hypothetical protein
VGSGVCVACVGVAVGVGVGIGVGVAVGVGVGICVGVAAGVGVCVGVQVVGPFVPAGLGVGQAWDCVVCQDRDAWRSPDRLGAGNSATPGSGLGVGVGAGSSVAAGDAWRTADFAMPPGSDDAMALRPVPVPAVADSTAACAGSRLAAVFAARNTTTSVCPVEPARRGASSAGEPREVLHAGLTASPIVSTTGPRGVPRRVACRRIAELSAATPTPSAKVMAVGSPWGMVVRIPRERASLDGAGRSRFMVVPRLAVVEVGGISRVIARTRTPGRTGVR